MENININMENISIPSMSPVASGDNAILKGYEKYWDSVHKGTMFINNHEEMLEHHAFIGGYKTAVENTMNWLKKQSVRDKNNQYSIALFSDDDIQKYYKEIMEEE